MYKLKPVFAVPLEIQNTCPMYKLKNLHEKVIDIFNKSDKDIYDEIQLSDQEIEILLKKQNDVLNTLEQLELRLNKLNIQFSDTKDDCVHVSENPSVSLPSCEVNKNYVQISKSKTTGGIENLIKTDTVVIADPENPPYSLLALPILWPGVLWNISYHVHSSIAKDLKELETIKLFKNISCKDYKRAVKVTVIWQHCTKPNPKVIRSPKDVLFGEMSLFQTFDQYTNTEKLIAAEQKKFDKVLDLINEVSCSANERISELYNLINDSNTKLDIKNILIWSLLYKKKNIPQNVEKWLEKFTKIIIS